MEFRILSQEEFKNNSEVSVCRNFFQSLNMYYRYKDTGYETYLLGVVLDNKVLASILLIATKNKRFGYKVFKAHRGPLLDYNNKQLLDFFIKNLIEFLKRKHGIFFYIEPYIPKTIRDSESNIVDTLNIDVDNNLKSLDFKSMGDFDQVDYLYVLDLENKTKEEVYSLFKANTKNIINKTINKYHLEIDILKYEELSLFKELTLKASIKHNFLDKDLSYYQEMYKYFKDRVMFLIAKVNKDILINSLTEELEKSKEKYDNTNNEKRKNMYKEEIENLNQELSLAKDLNEGSTIISGAMFILDRDEVVYLFSGSDDAYLRYNGQYAIQWYMIKYAIENKYKRYNFYGISRDLKDGVYSFKRGFNGYVIETLGTYRVGLNSLGRVLNKRK